MTQNVTSFPVQSVRDQFPALKRTFHERTVAYFDGPGGSQVVKSAIEAMTAYMERGGANLHGSFPSSWETEDIIADTKALISDFLNVKPAEVAFGANMTTLTLAIARALGRQWGAGDEIVVSEIDHRANVDPWIQMAKDQGMTIRWISVDPNSMTLNLDELQHVINENTKLVAVGLASNAVGTINDVPTIAEKAHEAGAIVAVDAVHGAPHITIDRDQLGADILLCSAYKFFGPHVGIAAIREAVFEKLEVYKLNPAPSFIPDKLETGTQNHEGIGGVKAAIEFFEGFGTGDTRRERLVSGIKQIEEYENSLATRMREGLRSLDKVTLYEADDSYAKTPTFAFTLDGYTPQEVCERMTEEHGIFVADGDFYATTLSSKCGVDQSGGWIRAGLAPYNTKEEVDRFLHALQQF
ncbi:cysteine desulfurase-like protein [Oceanobacillus halotolerans]|uniref:cysteine desulfurase-like protein n=1 Tax=Oceanobacillus halotolerans TaxID=2663380 RepID=UPI0013DD73B3|nr:cysteine desulfurase-like protein [Oceanobacillus halotolerans]